MAELIRQSVDQFIRSQGKGIKEEQIERAREAAGKYHAKDILSIVKIEWLNEELYQQSVTAFLGANRRNLSLVDCSSFMTMFQLNLSQVFTFDTHFAEQGFEILKYEM